MFRLDVPIDENYRVDHGDLCKEYGTGPDTRGRCYIKRIKTGWLWKCHNCGASGYKSYDPITLAKELINPATVNATTTARPPQFMFPLRKGGLQQREIEWLHKYELTENDAYAHSLYHTALAEGEGLILPFHNTYGYPAGYQIRTWNDGEFLYPKYITRKDKSQTNLYFRNYRHADSAHVVVVEDILSAIKVGNCGVSALALLGSPQKLPKDISDELAAKFNRITIWLDRDKALYSAEYARRFISLYGAEAGFIVTDVDPKAVPYPEMKNMLAARCL